MPILLRNALFFAPTEIRKHMTYSEEGDFNEKRNALAEMHARLERAGISFNLATANVLEIGGAGGVLAGLLSSNVRRVVVSDIVDHQLLYAGEFPRLLKEKFQRNGSDFAFERLEFHVADATDLPYKDNLFDVVVSYNAFEHIPDPVRALQEAFRVVRKGGLIYLTFDPIWTADSGNHFVHLVPEPWKHLVCTEDEFCKEMSLAGATEAELQDFRHGLNRKHARVYKSDFPLALRSLGAASFHTESWAGCVVEGNEAHPNRVVAAKILGCPEDDLLLRGFCFCITK